jgi:hypothetical protein
VISVVLVLKSGGDFKPAHLSWVKAGLAKHLSRSFVIRCLTDYLGPGSAEDIPAGIEVVPLRHDLPGWWSKIEVFSVPPGPALYLDLDTSLVGPIDGLADAVLNLGANEFLMLRRFRREGWASGMMGWNGNCNWVQSRFLGEMRAGGKFLQDNWKIGLKMNGKRYQGDQSWIAKSLESVGKIIAVQDVFPGIYSFRCDVRPRMKLPDDAKIVCFHGRPRPWDIAGLDPALSRLREPTTKNRAL